MKKNILAILSCFSFYLSYAQWQPLEKDALEYILSGKDSTLQIRDSIIFLNSQISKAPALAYFSDRRWWHIQNILKIDCYGEADSLENEKIINHKYSLDINNNRIKAVSDTTLRNTKEEVKAYVYKRFFYCGHIYVLIYLSNPFNHIKTQFLVIFDLHGKLLFGDAYSYIN